MWDEDEDGSDYDDKLQGDKGSDDSGSESHESKRARLERERDSKPTKEQELEERARLDKSVSTSLNYSV